MAGYLNAKHSGLYNPWDEVNWRPGLAWGFTLSFTAFIHNVMHNGDHLKAGLTVLPLDMHYPFGLKKRRVEIFVTKNPLAYTEININV